MSTRCSHLLRRRLPWTPWIVAALTLASFSALADEATERAERVYVIGGATIRWDLDRAQQHPPAAERAARLAEELRRWLATGQGEDVKQVEAETLPGGARRARVPLSLMNFAVARLDGETAGICAEGPSSVRQALTMPVVAAPEEK